METESKTEGENRPLPKDQSEESIPNQLGHTENNCVFDDTGVAEFSLNRTSEAIHTGKKFLSFSCNGVKCVSDFKRNLLVYEVVKNHQYHVHKKRITGSEGQKHTLVSKANINVKGSCPDNTSKGEESKANCETIVNICSKEKSHECEKCNRRFSKSSHLISHKLTHTDIKFHTCEICSKQFRQASNLRVHIQTHTQDKLHSCDICKKKFALPSYLKKHKQLHTGRKSHACIICEKQFSYISHLKSHMYLHTGESPYKCDKCDKTFKQSSNLKSHIFSHTGSRNHKCDICDKKFSQQSHLKAHMRTHDKEKSYSCSVCGKLFANAYNVRKHMLRHSCTKDQD